MGRYTIPGSLAATHTRPQLTATPATTHRSRGAQGRLSGKMRRSKATNPRAQRLPTGAVSRVRRTASRLLMARICRRVAPMDLSIRYCSSFR